MLGEEGAPGDREIISEITVASHGEQERGIGEVERNHPFHESEAVGGNFRRHVKPRQRAKRADADLPGDRPAIR